MYFGWRRSRKETKEKKRTGSYKVCVHAKARTCLSPGLRQAQEDLAKHEISADHRRSMLLPKRQRQIDFVTANDHANSAIIAHMRTVLTQAMYRLPTAKNAFMRKPSRYVRCIYQDCVFKLYVNIRILCLYNISYIRPSKKETSFSSGLF